MVRNFPRYGCSHPSSELCSIILNQYDGEADKHHSQDDKETQQIISCQEEVDYPKAEHYQSRDEDDEREHIAEIEVIFQQGSIFAYFFYLSPPVMPI